MDLRGFEVDLATVTRVAGKALGGEGWALEGRPDVSPIGAVHNDRRTLAILRVSGQATLDSSRAPWSAVVKVVDPRIQSGEAAKWVSVEAEEKVYELGLFQGTDVPFRAARCYAIANQDSGLRHLWLEDLTGAPVPPWTIDQYVQTSYNLGRFDGGNAVEPPEIPLELPSRIFLKRWAEPSQITARFDVLRGPHAGALARGRLREALRLEALAHRLSAVASSLPTTVAHGDSHARNLFPVGAQTVAIDWSGLSREPLGADMGVLAGSGLTWGVDEAVAVASNERSMFSRYLEGLADAGWDGDVDDVRVAFFAQFTLYLSAIVITPVQLAAGELEGRRPFYEARLQTKLEDLPARLDHATALLLPFIDELDALLRRIR